MKVCLMTRSQLSVTCIPATGGVSTRSPEAATLALRHCLQCSVIRGPLESILAFILLLNYSSFITEQVCLDVV